MNKHLKKLFFFSILLAFAGFGCNFSNSPEAIIKTMKKNMIGLDGFAFDLQFSGQAQQLLDQSIASTFKAGEMVMSLTGKMDFSGDDLQLIGDFDVESKGDTPISLKGEARFVDGQRYMRLSSFDIGGDSAAPINPDIFTDKWILTSPTVEEDELDRGSNRKLYKLFTKTNFFSDIKDLSEGDVFKYQVKLDADAIVKFIEEVAAIRGEEFTALAKADANKRIDDLRDSEIIITIGKEDKFLRSVQISSFVSDEALNQMVDFTLAVNLSDYNTNVEVSVPEGVTYIQNLLLQQGVGTNPLDPTFDNPIVLPEGFSGSSDPADWTQEDFDKFQKFFDAPPPGV